MTPEQFEALEEVIEEIELARIEQETGSQTMRLQRARILLDEFLKASEEVNPPGGKESERPDSSQNLSRLGPPLSDLLT